MQKSVIFVKKNLNTNIRKIKNIAKLETIVIIQVNIMAQTMIIILS